MPQASKSDIPPAESTARTSTVNALTLPALLEMNYRLRSRAVTAAEYGATETLTTEVSSRVLQWLDEQHSTTPPAAHLEPNREPPVTESSPTNVHLTDD